MTTAAENFPFTYRGENEVLLGRFPKKSFIPSYGRHRDGFVMRLCALECRIVMEHFPCIIFLNSNILRNKMKIRQKILKNSH